MASGMGIPVPTGGGGELPTAAETAATAATAHAQINTAWSSGMIDTKTLGRPERFSGKNEEWSSWAFIFKAWVGCLPGDADALMDEAQNRDHEVKMEVLRPQQQSVSKGLYYSLTLLTRGKAFNILRSVVGKNGLETWRLFTREYEPHVGQRMTGMLTGILKYQFDGNPRILPAVGEPHRGVRDGQVDEG